MAQITEEKSSLNKVIIGEMPSTPKKKVLRTKRNHTALFKTDECWKWDASVCGGNYKRAEFLRKEAHET